MTPQRRPVRATAAAVAQNKENRSPAMAQTPPAGAPIWVTPTKTSPGGRGHEALVRSVSAVESLGQKHPWGLEVKNTFIHYGSPLKTISVVTPPKTVPSNFAPEHVFLDKIRTPLLLSSHHASTPSTTGVGAHAHISAGTALSVPSAAGVVTTAAPPMQGGVAGTLLRLSDFLPSPAAAAAGQVVGQAPAGCALAPCCEAAPVNWQGFEAAQSLMPPVPPLPGPGFGVASPQGYSAVPSFGFDTAAQQMNFQQDHSAGVSMVAVAAASAGPAIGPCGAPGVTIAYDGTLQYLQGTAGDAPSMMSATSPMMGTYAAAPQPQMGEPPSVPAMVMGEQVSFHLNGPCSQPSAGVVGCGTLSGASSATGSMLAGSCGVGSGGSCGYAVEAQRLCDARRVAISVGHFPEPSVSPVIPQPQQPTQLPPPPPPQQPQAQPQQPLPPPPPATPAAANTPNGKWRSTPLAAASQTCQRKRGH